jgi:hypothetical protein
MNLRQSSWTPEGDSWRTTSIYRFCFTAERYYQVMVGKEDMAIYGWRQLIEWSLKHSCMTDKEYQEVWSVWQFEWDHFVRWIIQAYPEAGDLAIAQEVESPYRRFKCSNKRHLSAIEHLREVASTYLEQKVLEPLKPGGASKASRNSARTPRGAQGRSPDGSSQRQPATDVVKTRGGRMSQKPEKWVPNT